MQKSQAIAIAQKALYSRGLIVLVKGKMEAIYLDDPEAVNRAEAYNKLEEMKGEQRNL